MRRGQRTFVRQSLAMLSAAVLAAAWLTAGGAAAVASSKAALIIVSVTDRDSGLAAPVQGRLFDVVVEVRDAAGKPTKVSKATTVALEQVSGPGVLGGTTTAVIPRNGSRATIAGATYSLFANGVKLRVRAVSGVALTPATVKVDVALTAVGRAANPGEPLDLSDPDCVEPTPEVPTCGYLLLPNGARGNVTLSLGSCDGIAACRTAEETTALVVLAVAELKDQLGEPLYDKQDPATLVVACHKVLCGGVGVPHLPLLVDLTNTGPLREAPPCPKQGVLGADQEACSDFVQSKRHAGNLYSYLLFDHDARASHP